MLKFYKDEKTITKEIPHFEENCWVRVVSPTKEEVAYLRDELKIDNRIITSSMDNSEISRVENKNGNLVVIVDAPFIEKYEDSDHFATYPISIIMLDKCIVTISIKPYSFFDEVLFDLIDTYKKENFVFILLSKIAKDYNEKLRQIESVKQQVEARLRDSVKNRELLDIMDIQKSLVYFTTALKRTEKIIQKIIDFNLALSPQDKALLDAILIEFQQAQESAQIYCDLLDNAVITWTSIISNNLNSVIKNLTIITIIIAIPTLVYSFYGMNVLKLPYIETPWFSTIFSVIITAIVTALLFGTKKKR